MCGRGLRMQSLRMRGFSPYEVFAYAKTVKKTLLVVFSFSALNILQRMAMMKIIH